MATRFYEGMFVVDSSKSGAEFPETVRLIAGILQRHHADIQRIEKWEERKFAYPIQGSKRGIYILTYFETEGGEVAGIREDVRLNEDILRVLIMKPEKVAPVQGELYNPEGEQIEEEPEPAEEGDEDAPVEASEEAEEEVPAAEAGSTEQ